MSLCFLWFARSQYNTYGYLNLKISHSFDLLIFFCFYDSNEFGSVRVFLRVFKYCLDYLLTRAPFSTCLLCYWFWWKCYGTTYRQTFFQDTTFFTDLYRRSVLTSMVLSRGFLVIPCGVFMMNFPSLTAFLIILAACLQIRYVTFFNTRL